MTELSPAAETVLDAYIRGLASKRRNAIAAALRAAADQFFSDWDGMCCEEHLKSIATELEAQ